MNIRDLISDLIPVITRRRDREKVAQQIVGAGCNNEAAKKVEVVKILRPDGDFTADCPYETDNVDKDPRDVGKVTSPVEAEPKVIGTLLTSAIEISDLVVAFTYEVIVGDDDTGDR